MVQIDFPKRTVFCGVNRIWCDLPGGNHAKIAHQKQRVWNRQINVRSPVSVDATHQQNINVYRPIGPPNGSSSADARFHLMTHSQQCIRRQIGIYLQHSVPESPPRHSTVSDATVDS
jgi:hypothetical protein